MNSERFFPLFLRLDQSERPRLGRKEPSDAHYIGCDFHTRYQHITMMDEATEELTERRLGE
jgi:hypothetical protein